MCKVFTLASTTMEYIIQANTFNRDSALFKFTNEFMLVRNFLQITWKITINMPASKWLVNKIACIFQELNELNY